MYQLHLCYTVISSPLKINCQDISKHVSIPVSVAYSTQSSNFLYTLQYPAVHTCSTRSTQCSTHSTQYPAVPTVPTVPCSTHGYCRSTQLSLSSCSTHSTRGYCRYCAVPAVPTVHCSTQRQYPQYRDCRSTHGYCAVPARVTNRPYVLDYNNYSERVLGTLHT